MICERDDAPAKEKEYGEHLAMWRVREQYIGLWEKWTGRKLFLFYLVHYTILFLLLAGIVFWPFLKAEKGFIWRCDGLPQYFTKLLYLSRVFHDSMRSFLAGEGWNLPLYDFRSGIVAQDIEVGFPQILAAFWPEDKINIFYYLHVLANYYLLGVSFSLFGFYFRRKPISIMTGAVAYVFCGYALYAGVRHPHFMTPMIFLPLLLIGAEKVLHKQRAWMLTGVVFLSVTTYYGLYFSCMQAVFVAIYSCVRFFDIYKKEKAWEFLKMTGRMSVWGGTGVLLACYSAVPTLLQILCGGRVGANVEGFPNMLWYKAAYYQNFMLNFIVVPNDFRVWAILGFSVIALPAVLLLFLRRQKEEQSLRNCFIIFTVMLCIPVVAYVMSGFSNISTRFIFGYAFLVSVIMMFMVPHFAEMERGMMARMGVLLSVYFLVCFFVCKHKEYQIRPFIMLLVVVMIFACCKLAGEMGRKWIPLFCLAASCFSAWYCSYLRYSPDELNYVEEFVQDPYSMLDQGQYASLASSKAVRDDEEFYRVAGDAVSTDELNVSFFYGLNGLSAYPSFGLCNAYIEWLEEMEVARGVSTLRHRIYDLDGRSALNSLAGIKYYAERETAVSFAPYGFVETEQIQKDNHKDNDVIWRNKHSLPLGYTYGKYLDRAEYNTLNTLGKQEAQLKAVVLEEDPLFTSLEKADVETTAVRIPYTIEEIKDLTWENGKIAVKEEGASMTLAFTGMPETETYLRIVNLDLTKGDSTRRWKLKADTGVSAAEACFCADAYIYTHGQKTQMLNMGYAEEGYDTITITFPEKGTFILDDIEIWCQPMDHYAEEIDRLREDMLDCVKIYRGGVTGTISVSKDKFLCMSIPYMDGWKAYVDGKEVKIYRANTAFMGVEVPTGEHEIVLRYRIPGLMAGLFMSGAGVLSLIVIIVSRKRNH